MSWGSKDIYLDHTKILPKVLAIACALRNPSSNNNQARKSIVLIFTFSAKFEHNALIWAACRLTSCPGSWKN